MSSSLPGVRASPAGKVARVEDATVCNTQEEERRRERAERLGQEDERTRAGGNERKQRRRRGLGGERKSCGGRMGVWTGVDGDVEKHEGWREDENKCVHEARTRRGSYRVSSSF
jgi:hypothetical protein